MYLVNTNHRIVHWTIIYTYYIYSVISDKGNIKQEIIIIDKEEYFIMITLLISQESITITNLYTPLSVGDLANLSQ